MQQPHQGGGGNGFNQGGGGNGFRRLGITATPLSIVGNFREI